MDDIFNFRIHEAILEDGERLPLLVDHAGNVPFLPSLYVMGALRPRDASSTISIKLNAIKLLYLWAAARGLDIEARFGCEEMLSLIEIDNLVYHSRFQLDQFKPSPQSSNSKVIDLKPDNITVVDYTTQAKRLHDITHYLNWITHELMKNIDRKNPKYEYMLTTLNRVLTAIKSRIPNRISASSSRINPPKGFSREIQQRILEVIEPPHPDNPFKNEFVKIRNQLYVTICIALGPRIGESLNIKLQDIDLSGDRPKIRIRRRPDDPEEDRSRAPRVKTLERTLPVAREWAALIHNYLNRYRKRLRKARKHHFLFVARDGEKLSYASACQIFATLKNRVDGIPTNFSQHLCRHAWNERFSEQAEMKGLTPDEIREARRNIMGWGISSRMPERYDRRFAQKKAEDLSIQMQENYFRNSK